MNTIILIVRICIGYIPSNILGLYAFFWQSSLMINLGMVNCLSLIHLSIAHSWSWVHDWQAKSIHQLCGLIISLHLAGVLGMDFYEVRNWPEWWHCSRSLLGCGLLESEKNL